LTEQQLNLARPTDEGGAEAKEGGGGHLRQGCRMCPEPRLSQRSSF